MRRAGAAIGAALVQAAIAWLLSMPWWFLLCTALGLGVGVFWQWGKA